MFDRSWFDIVDELPAQDQWRSIVRGWDKAASRPTPEYPDPDWTRGVKGILCKNGQVYIADMVSLRDHPGKLDVLMKTTAKQDGPSCYQAFWIDPAQAGKVDEMHTTAVLRREMPNCKIVWEADRKDKTVYAKPFSQYCDPSLDGIRKVSLLAAPWNDAFLSELESFPVKKAKKDIVDACSRMWIELERVKGLGPGSNRWANLAQARA
jgi:phage terminase large subunit-like protein